MRGIVIYLNGIFNFIDPKANILIVINSSFQRADGCKLTSKNRQCLKAFCQNIPKPWLAKKQFGSNNFWRKTYYPKHLPPTWSFIILVVSDPYSPVHLPYTFNENYWPKDQHCNRHWDNVHAIGSSSFPFVERYGTLVEYNFEPDCLSLHLLQLLI